MSLVSSIGNRFRAEFLAQIIHAVCSALTVVILARLLDPNGYGLLFLAIAVVEISKMFAKLGVPESAARYIAEYKEDNPTQLPHILRTSSILLLVLVASVATVMTVGHELIANRLDEPELAPFLLVGVVYLIFNVLTGYARSILQAFEAIQLASVVKIIQGVGKVVFAIGLVLAGFGAIGALGGYALRSFLAALFGLVVIYLLYYRTFEAAAEMEHGLKRRMAEYSVPLMLTQAAKQLDSRVDTLLVGFFLNPAAVSFYAVSNQIIDFLQTPAAALGFTISPTFGAEKAAGNVDGAARLYETSLVHSLLLYTPAAAGLVLVADPLIELVFGIEYIDAVPVLQVLSLYAVLIAVMDITSHGLDFLGRARARAIVRGITAVLNVGLNIVLIPTIGVVGAAIATITTFSLYTIASVYIIHQEFDLRVPYLLKNTATIVVITGVMSTVVFLLLGYVQGWVTLLLVVAVGVIVWAVLSILAGLLDVQRIVRAVT
ncbi:flippase [Halalkalicoccus tibetensis]|uniref:Flippase n=1 Tax=Halalkalicoccus tibetensis TaxID=175632 RepID=A0ABD5VA43_9EURY